MHVVQSLVLLVPAPGEGEIDEAGLAALAVLRAMGLPQVVALVPSAPAGLQAKAAAKKHAAALLSSQVKPKFSHQSCAAPNVCVLFVAVCALPLVRPHYQLLGTLSSSWSWATGLREVLRHPAPG